MIPQGCFDTGRLLPVLQPETKNVHWENVREGAGEADQLSEEVGSSGAHRSGSQGTSPAEERSDTETS